MTILLELKTCPACHRRYSRNPDLGHFRCPHCGGLGDGKKHFFRKLFEKKKGTSGDDETVTWKSE
jgi:predicted RNA-binding Zn-ribbon protein involved in translation (DUF1610 family)